MAYFSDEVRRRVLKGVVKTPRTATEIGERVGYSGRFIGKVLADVLKGRGSKSGVKKVPGRPARYTKV